jgi:hypothetical protein
MTAQVLDCDLGDFPCTWQDVSEDVVERSRELGRTAHQQGAANGSYLEAAAWLEAQEGVAEVIADEGGVRFRLEGGRPVWLLERPVAAARNARAFLSARLPGPMTPAGAGDPEPERGLSFDAVVGDDPDEKTATVLAPFAWHPGMDAGSIATMLEQTRGYEGGVEYLANWAEDDTTVWFDTFAELPGQDVVYIKSYGGRVCPPNEGCHATVAVQELNDPDFHLDESQAAVMDIIVWPDGSESLSASADFFRSAMPGGIPKALIFMDVEQIIDDDLTRAIKHPTSEYYYWDGYIVVADSLPVIRSYIAELSESARSPAVVYHEMSDELRVQGTLLVGVRPADQGALRIREVVRLADPATGELRDGSTIRVDGELGDDVPDILHVVIEVEGMTEEEAATTTVNLLVDGEPVDPPQNPAEGTRFGDYAYGLSWDAEVPDIAEGQQIELEAIAQLTEGGLSRHHVTVTPAGEDGLGTVWEGVVTSVSDTYFPGVTITRRTHVVFVRDPDEEPDAEEITFLVTGGSTSWEIAGSDGNCTFAFGPIEEDLPVEDGGGITFDLDEAANGVISYYGSGDIPGTEILVSKVCRGDDQSYTTSTQGSWWLAPRDEEFLVSGTTAEGSWSRGSVLDTEYDWTFTRVR